MGDATMDRRGRDHLCGHFASACGPCYRFVVEDIFHQSRTARPVRSATQDTVFFFQAEDGIRDLTVTGVQTCALPISSDFSELAFQERPNVHSVNTEWKSDSNRFEAHCDQRAQANREARQESGRVRKAAAKMVWHKSPALFYAEMMGFSLLQDTCFQDSSLVPTGRIRGRRLGLATP